MENCPDGLVRYHGPSFASGREQGEPGMLACLDKPPKLRSQRAEVPKVTLCEVKYRLTDAFLEAVREMNIIENQQIQAVIEGDTDFSRFDLLLHFAQEEKDKAKYSWIAHVESHGC
jgi:hypothetical protein